MSATGKLFVMKVNKEQVIVTATNPNNRKNRRFRFRVFNDKVFRREILPTRMVPQREGQGVVISLGKAQKVKDTKRVPRGVFLANDSFEDGYFLTRRPIGYRNNDPECGDLQFLRESRDPISLSDIRFESDEIETIFPKRLLPNKDQVIQIDLQDVDVQTFEHDVFLPI